MHSFRGQVAAVPQSLFASRPYRKSTQEHAGALSATPRTRASDAAFLQAGTQRRFLELPASRYATYIGTASRRT